jgi:hypothetical protein
VLLGNQSTHISWKSFLFASLDETILNPDNLAKAFKFMCSTSDQKNLSCEELKVSMIRRGHIFSAQSEERGIDEILERAGIHHDCEKIVHSKEGGEP